MDILIIGFLLLLGFVVFLTEFVNLVQPLVASTRRAQGE
jgi:hypothetical protein